MNLIVITYFSHLLNDFVFCKKYKPMTLSSLEEFKYLFKHALVMNIFIGSSVYIVTAILNNNSHDIGGILSFMRIIFLVSVCHLVADLLMSMVKRYLFTDNGSTQFETVFYTVNQLVHLGVIYFAIRLILGVAGWYSTYKQMFELIRLRNGLILLQIIGILIILCTLFSEKFVEMFLKGTGIVIPNESKTLTYHLGGPIGNLERMLILLFFLANSVPSISIIVAVKAVTRFKDLEKSADFAEYYLVGSLLSLLLGCMVSAIGWLLLVGS